MNILRFAELSFAKKEISFNYAIITGDWRKARSDNSITLRLLSNVIFYDEKAFTNISTTATNAPQQKVKRLICNEKAATSIFTTVTDGPKRKIKRPTTDEQNTSCDERKLPEANYVTDNLANVTPSRMHDQHSLT